jgi:hypothetical protein
MGSSSSSSCSAPRAEALGRACWTSSHPAAATHSRVTLTATVYFSGGTSRE